MITTEFEISLKYNGGSVYKKYIENHRTVWDCLKSVQNYLRKVMSRQAGNNTASAYIPYDGRGYNFFFSLRGNHLFLESMNNINPIQADQDLKSLAWKVANEKHLAIEALKKNIEIWKNNPDDAKRPMMGDTYLWFCSPDYGLYDSNRWKAMPIEGNERFCETICKLADKYFV